MIDEHFYHVVIESTVTILELIQRHQTNIQISRVMNDYHIVLFAFRRQMSNGTSVYTQSQVRPQPHLSMDLQQLFIDFFQMLNCTV